MVAIVVGQGRCSVVIARPFSTHSSPSTDKSSTNTLLLESKVPSVPVNDHGGLSGWRAIKMVSAPPNGKMNMMVPHDVLKEAMILKRLDCPHITRILDHSYEASMLEHHLHLPLFAIPLSKLFRDPSFPFPPILTPTYIPETLSYQVISAVSHISSRGIAHRDICPSNLLLDFNGNLKLVDFGTAYCYSPANYEGVDWDETAEALYCDVGTGPYRAPELLFSPAWYDAAKVDIWAAGCVIAQFFRPFGSLPGSTSVDSEEEDDPLERPTGQSYSPLSGKDTERRPLFDATFGSLGLAASIFRIRGTPTPESWHDFVDLPDAGKIEFPPSSPTPLDFQAHLPELQRLGPTAQEALEVIDNMLHVDPKRRSGPDQLLTKAWFDSIEKKGAAAGGTLTRWIEEARAQYALLGVQ